MDTNNATKNSSSNQMADLAPTQLAYSIRQKHWDDAYSIMMDENMDHKNVECHYSWDTTNGPLNISLRGMWVHSLLTIGNNVYEVTAYLGEHEANCFYDTGMIDNTLLHVWLHNNRNTWKSQVLRT